MKKQYNEQRREIMKLRKKGIFVQDAKFEMNYNPEILQTALRSGIINYDEVSQSVEEMKREEILSKHCYDIWPGKDGLLHTYLPGDKKRIPRRRREREQLEDVIVEFYRKQAERIYIRDVFDEWIEGKLKHKEIKPQSYDRYRTDFERFFPQNNAICRKQIKDISSKDLTEFIKSTICELELTEKSYAGLRILIRGIFKYAKACEYTEFSITQFMGDLDLSKNMFKKNM